MLLPTVPKNASLCLDETVPGVQDLYLIQYTTDPGIFLFVFGSPSLVFMNKDA